MRMMMISTSRLLLVPSTLLLAVAVVNVNVVRGQDASCDLPCENDSPCVMGPASFDSHPLGADGKELTVHSEESINGMHCACPHGWTGLLCDTPYESCNYEHKCYNGGQCIPGLLDQYGNDQLYCDCSNAVDLRGNKYVGKFCEHTSTDYCDESAEHFCLHGGTCNPNYSPSSMEEPCVCTPEYEGENCEFKRGTVPECEKPCQNGGRCILNPDQGEVDSGGSLDEDPDDFMSCSCPEEYAGEVCTVPRVKCGDDYCYNGGSCVERVVDGMTLHHCNCLDSYTEETSYAGRYCEFKATSYCTKNGGLNGHLFCVNGGRCNLDDPYKGCDCADSGGFTGFSCEFADNIVQNGGGDGGDGDSTIGDGGGGGTGVGGSGDPPLQPIGGDGGDGSSGSGTEDHFGGEDMIMDNFNPPAGDSSSVPPPPPPPPDCSLACMNGGVCRFGEKDLDGSPAGQVLQNTVHLNETSQNFQHCVCPPGFIGVMCQHQVEECDGEGQHICLHGSKCVMDGDEDACDCDAIENNDLSDFFVGDHCEHPINDICTVGTPKPGKPLSFCVNGGTCLKKVDPTEEHPGCRCEDGWKGPHCELRDARSSSSPSSYAFDPRGRSPADKFEIAVVTISTIALIAVLSCLVFLCLRNRNQSKTRSDIFINQMRWDRESSGGGYRDDPQVNIAPRRKSVEPTMMDDQQQQDEHHHDQQHQQQDERDLLDDVPGVYPVSAHNSSRDPMVTHLAPDGPKKQQQQQQKQNNPDVIPNDEHYDSNDDDDNGQPEIYIGPPRDEDGHELHNVNII